MLENSFIHIPGVGRRTEQRIWSSGVCSLEQFSCAAPSFLTSSKAKHVQSHVSKSINSIKSSDAGYFYENLSPCDSWRMFREFRNSVAYVDIETTGLGAPADIITTIALYDGSRVFTYVQGENLEEFSEDIRKYKVLVTYNGKTFDVPFIERYLGVNLSFLAHLDLRYILRSLGISGGLKSCERQLGIGREGDLASVDGFFAVLLWNEFSRTGDRAVLETLLAYNIEDTVNLEFLMVEAYNRKLKEIPLNLSAISLPEHHVTPYSVDPSVVKRVQQMNWGWMQWN